MQDYMNKFVKTDTFGRWEMRNTAYVRGLSHERQAELRDAVKRHNDRLQNPPLGPAALAGVQKEETMRGSSVHIRALLKQLYRMPTGSWAGGDVMVRIKKSMRPYAHGRSERVWSHNGRWSGNDAYFRLDVQAAWCKYVLAEGLASAGGLLTTHAKRIAPDTWKATWIEQGRGFDLRSQTGVIVKAYGRFFRGSDEEKARRKVKSWERKVGLLGVREHHDTLVTLDDAIAVSRCPTGSRAFADRFFPGRDSATVAELIDHISFSPFVAQAIHRAIARADANAANANAK